jgi:putative ABC transport system substrate-binding protein
MKRSCFIRGAGAGLALAILSPRLAAQAVPRRIGVLHLGGAYLPAVDGLREGFKEAGLIEGRQVVLDIRDLNGNPSQIESAAKALEASGIDVLVVITVSAALAAKRATTRVPIVFYAGTDPVAIGLVESYRRPGGRLTGIHRHSTDLTAKRLQLLGEMIPRLQRVVTFYNASNPAAQRSVGLARQAARQLKIELVERPVKSIAELRSALAGLRPQEFDAYFQVSDAMVTSQIALVIETAAAKRLPTMVQERGIVTQGALAAYGESYHEIGRLSARFVQRILGGEAPSGMPVEQVDRIHFVVNLKTAKALGLAIPPSVLARVDEVVE